MQNEARICTLHHINIVKLLAIILEPPQSNVSGHCGIVMEYVQGGALDEFLLAYIV